MVVCIWWHFALKHHPLKPRKHTKLAYVRCFSRHNYFGDFSIQFVNAMSSIGPYIGVKIKVIIPKSFWGARLNELLTGTFHHFFYLSLSCIKPWCEWFEDFIDQNTIHMALHWAEMALHLIAWLIKKIPVSGSVYATVAYTVQGCFDPTLRS